MTPSIAAALRTATTADLLDVLGEILEPSMNGPLGKSYPEDADYEAFMDECLPVSRAYRAACERLARTVERRAA